MPPTYIGLPRGLVTLGIVFPLIVLAVASVASFVTGHRSRDYINLPASTIVRIAGQPVLIEQLAHDFKPLLFLAPGNISPPAIEMWWEAIDAGNSIALVYHPVWLDEHHPVPVLHWIYFIYRALVYGLPVRDIEYIQINIALDDGHISKIRYEGSSSTFYYSWFVSHTYVTVKSHAEDYVKETLTAGKQNTESIHFKGPHTRFGIVSWSHQFSLLDNESSKEYTLPVTMPLESLSEENYTKFKLARRSQGDFMTEDSVIGRVAKFTVGVLFLGVPYLISKFFYSNT